MNKPLENHDLFETFVEKSPPALGSIPIKNTKPRNNKTIRRNRKPVSLLSKTGDIKLKSSNGKASGASSVVIQPSPMLVQNLSIDHSEGN